MSLRKIVIGVGIVAVVGYYLLGNKVKKIIEDELGNLEEKFDYFNKEAFDLLIPQ